MPKNIIKREPVEVSRVYRLSENAAFEAFDDGALILNLEKVTFTELNPTARDILKATDGRNSLKDVAATMAGEYEIEIAVALQDVNEIYQVMLKQNLIEEILFQEETEAKMEKNELDAISYLCNPDVVLREEDEDGGLLFNPDTGQVRVVNSTGLYIWQQFVSPNQPEKVIEAIQNNFEEAAPEVVQADFKEFLDEMIQNGFIGEVK